MTRATDDALDSLHEAVTLTLAQEIQRYRNGEMKGAEGETLPIPPALLAQAIKLLKDNGIDTPARAGGRTDTLKAAMPDFDEADNVLPFRR